MTDQIDRPSRKPLLDVAHQDCCALLDRAGGRHAGDEDLGIVAFEDFFDASPVRDLEGWEGSGTEMVKAEELRSQRGQCVSKDLSKEIEKSGRTPWQKTTGFFGDSSARIDASQEDRVSRITL